MTAIQPAASASEFPLELFASDLGPWFGRPNVNVHGSRKAFAVLDPATAQPIAEISGATAHDAVRAIDIASEAFRSWSMEAPRKRADVLRRASMLLRQRGEQFARLITLEMGKILANSRREVELAIEYMDWFAEETVRIEGSFGLSPDGFTTMLTVKKPVGVTFLVTPWNFPLVTIVRKVAPALAAGCTAILKPSEETPLTAIALADLLAEAGMPEGVLCVLPSAEPVPLVRSLMSDVRVRKLSFTGSLQVGRILQQQAAHNMMRTSMELGGNAPFIVFEDAEISATVEDAVAAKLSATGQVCTAPNRFLVHESRYREFCQGLADRFSSKRVGPGLDPRSDVGPLISSRARQRIADMVTDATQRGAALLAGGKIPASDGFFLNPTVVGNVPEGSILWQSEIFGPVAQVVPFRDEAHAVALSNQSEAGLSGYAYTQDVGRILRLSRQLRVGMLGVNKVGIVNAKAPFGGVSAAGMGREGGPDGIKEYLDMTYIGIHTTDL
jgi:succinate-semialdehyde dehydrogenase/glutarate-semialdehyde dehydrogenase